jgi:CheY-like chemotaxis protein
LNPVPNPPLRILLADDDVDDRMFFKKALKEIPIATHLTIVSNGEALMEHLAEHSKNLPDILDLSMPRKTGIECLAEIKESPILKDLRVVMISTLYSRDAHYEESVIKMLRDLGAQDFIRKPGNIEQLKKAVHEAIIRTTATKP